MNSNRFKSDTVILVVSCDGYKDLWEPYFNSFFKYWPDCPYQVYLGSNESTYSDSRVKSILIGPDKDYSSNLLSMLKKIDSKWLILWIEDLFLYEKIDNDYISKLMGIAKKNKAGYLKLDIGTPWSFTNNKKDLVGPLPKGIRYRSGIGLALWNKNTLTKLLIPGESAWEIERNGSKRSNSFKEPFYSLTPLVRKKPPIKVINSVIKGKWSPRVIRFLKKEGYSKLIPLRNHQSLGSYLYSKAYLFRLDIFRILRKYWYE